MAVTTYVCCCVFMCLYAWCGSCNASWEFYSKTEVLRIGRTKCGTRIASCELGMHCVACERGLLRGWHTTIQLCCTGCTGRTTECCHQKQCTHRCEWRSWYEMEDCMMMHTLSSRMSKSCSGVSITACKDVSNIRVWITLLHHTSMTNVKCVCLPYQHHILLCAVVPRTLREDTCILTSCGMMWRASYGRLVHTLTKEAEWEQMPPLLR